MRTKTFTYNWTETQENKHEEEEHGPQLWDWHRPYGLWVHNKHQCWTWQITFVVSINLSFSISIQDEFQYENTARTWICSVSLVPSPWALDKKCKFTCKWCSSWWLSLILLFWFCWNTTNSRTSSVFRLKLKLKAHPEAESSCWSWNVEESHYVYTQILGFSQSIWIAQQFSSGLIN